jgi:F-type H+-transporting ATPase subunit c
MVKHAKLVLWTLVFSVIPTLALAADEGGGASNMSYMGYAIGAGLGTGLAGLGCGIGQGLTAGNTTAGIARNPGAAGALNTPFILGMVLIESIAIYGLLVGLLLWLKLP